jgi:hypothetical protein
MRVRMDDTNVPAIPAFLFLEEGRALEVGIG